MLAARTSCLVFLALLTRPASGDTWQLPTAHEVASGNHKFTLLVNPSKLRGQLDYFVDKSRGKLHPGMTSRTHCTGTLSELRKGKKHQVWTADLVNEVAPVEVLVADDGRYVVTFDNWHSAGYGSTVVVIYGSKGTVLRRFSLEQLLTKDELRHVEASVSSRWWRQGAWIDSPKHQLFIACNRPSRDLVIDFQKLSVRAANDDDVRAGVRDEVGSQLTLPLELARERSLHGLNDSFKHQLADDTASVEVRLRAAAAMRAVGDSTGKDLVKTVARGSYKGASLKDRGVALGMLPDFLGGAALPILREAMRGQAKNETWGPCQEAFVQLGRASVPTLLAMLQDQGTPDYRGGAAHALAKIGDKASLPTLLRYVKDPNEYVAEAACNAAKEIGGAEVAKPFSQLLKEGTSQDGNIAVYFLKERSPEAAPALVAALERHLSRPGGRDFQEDFGVSSIVQALEFQSGVHLGRDVTRWRAWLALQKPTPTSALERGQMLARLDDGAAGHWLARACLDQPDKAHRALSEWMGGRPRLAGVWSDRDGGGNVLSADGRRALFTGRSQSRVWDLISGASMARIALRAEHVELSQDGQRAVLDDFGKLSIWDTTSGQRVSSIDSQGSTDHAHLSPDGKILAVLANNSASLWDVESGRKLRQLQCGLALKSTFSSDGSKLVVASRPLLVYDIPHDVETVSQTSAQDVAGLRHRDAFLALDQNLGAAALLDFRGASLLTLEKGGPDPNPTEMEKQLGLVSAGGRAIETWALAPNDAFVAFAFRDGDVRVRSLTDGKLAMETQLPEATALAFSADGGKLAVACHETGTVTIFSTQTGSRLGQLQFLENHSELNVDRHVWVRDMAFQSDGHLVVSPNADRSTVTLWEPNPPALPPDLDAPPELEELSVQVCTGHRLVGDALQQLDPEQYLALKHRWKVLSEQHATQCQHKNGNLWLQWGRSLPPSFVDGERSQ